VSGKKKPPDEYSTFKRLLDRIAKVPKEEIKEREREYQREREAGRKKKRA
jgi:hypothetical protein